MIATEVLDRHHRSILDLFGQYRRTGRRRKKELFERIRRALKFQFALEEEMLYPAISGRPTPEADRRMGDALEKHLAIDELLLSLSESRYPSRRFESGMDGLLNCVKEHLQLERSGPYGDLLRRLKPKALEKLGLAIRARVELFGQTLAST